MRKYKVEVKREHRAYIVVEAEDEQAALKKAESDARWAFVQWHEGQITGSRAIDSGPADRPLVKLPKTWEIYSSMPGSDKANEAISDAASRCAEAMLTWSKKNDIGPKLVMELVNKHVRPVFKKYSKYGTGDTEPRANMAHFLATYAKELGAGESDEIYEAVRWNL